MAESGYLVVLITAGSYEVPEIIALPIVEGNPGYLAWLGQETEMK